MCIIARNETEAMLLPHCTATDGDGVAEWTSDGKLCQPFDEAVMRSHANHSSCWWREFQVSTEYVSGVLIVGEACDATVLRIRIHTYGEVRLCHAGYNVLAIIVAGNN